MKVKQILNDLEVVPSKRRGQNFLLNQDACRSIFNFAEIEQNAAVLEIGPGLGALTEQILERTKQIALVEIEQKFCEHLLITFSELNPELLFNKSFVDIDLDLICKKLSSTKINLLSNVPYSLSSELFLWIIENRKYFSSASLLLQREFAERLAASPGGREYGSLSVLCSAFTNASLGNIFSGQSFFPSADVESRLIRLEILPESKYKIDDFSVFEKVIRSAFSHRRKTIFNSLKSSQLGLSADQVKSCLEQAGFKPTDRAETFSAEQYAILANVVKLVLPLVESKSANPG